MTAPKADQARERQVRPVLSSLLVPSQNLVSACPCSSGISEGVNCYRQNHVIRDRACGDCCRHSLHDLRRVGCSLRLGERLTMGLKAIGAMAMLLALAACQAGQEDDGPVEGFLVLERPDGSVAEFDLGRSSTFKACARMVTFELQTAEEDHSGEFWTNPGFNYGGDRPREGWTRNVVRGGGCEHEAVRRQQPEGCGANDPLCIRE